MPIRFYLVPIDQVSVGTRTMRLPKYITPQNMTDPRGAQLVTAPLEMKDYGLEPTALVCADVTAADHSTLTGQSDVTAVPLNLDNTLGGNLATVQAALESLHIPADALVAGGTYRQVLRGIIAIFAVAGQFHLSANAGLFPAGITLATTLGELSLNVRNKLKAAAEVLGYDYSGLTLTSTLRDVLKQIANQATPGGMLGTQI